MAKNANLESLAIKIPKLLHGNLQDDAVKFQRAKAKIVIALLEEHFRLKQSARQELYRRISKKVFGRPISKS